MLTRQKLVGPVLYLLVGVASAILGLLPWLITGMRLPLQNLWALNTLPAEMPVALLPFSQYQLTVIVGVIVTGSAIAGVVARATRAQHPRFALMAIVVGVVAVQAIATVQTAVTLSNGLRNTTVADIYLAALVAGTVATILLGLAVLLLIALAPSAGAVIAISIAAIVFTDWLNALVHPVGVVATAPAMALLGGTRWVPAVIVGLAVVWCGLGTIGRVLAAMTGLLVLWIGPALGTAVTSAAGSRVLAANPAEMVDYGRQVFVSALGSPGGSLSLLIAAVIVMILGLAVRWAIRRRRPERASVA